MRPIPLKLSEAQAILRDLAVPLKQQNEPSGYTLLALAGISRTGSWAAATNETKRVHDILDFVREAHGKNYAENSRETVRRQVLHQFEQARIVDRNPDDPGRPTNSGKTCYALTEEALRVVRAYGTKRYVGCLRDFLSAQTSLAEKYQRRRAQHLIEVDLPNGIKVYLSGGRHNTLQASVISKFHKRFIPASKVLYIGDAADKDVFVDTNALSELFVPYSTHDKLPDVLFHWEEKNWLVLVEAVTSHGPVSPKRRDELEATLASCPANRVYVSAFESFAEFKKHLSSIAWDSEVWIAEAPDHMIHFNGPKFLGPVN